MDGHMNNKPMTIDDLLALPKGHKTVRKYLEWGLLYEAQYTRKRERFAAKRGEKTYTIPTLTPNEINDKIMGALKVYEVALLDKWMVEGIPLGNCTPAMLIAAAIHEESKAEGHALNAQFYRAIAAEGKKGQPIRKALGVDRVETLRARTFSNIKVLEPI